MSGCSRRLKRVLTAVAATVVLVGYVVLQVNMFSPRAAQPNPFDGGAYPAYDPTYQGKVAQAIAEDPANADVYRRLEKEPTAKWFGAWNSPEQVTAQVASYIQGAGERVPVLVLYAVPGVDCNTPGDSGLDAQTYARWVREVARGVGSSRAAIILEPDALAALGTCKSNEGDRMGVLRDAVDVLAGLPNAATYIDAGHSSWQSVDVMSQRLDEVGVRKVRGFALNVSNGRPDKEVRSYGRKLARKVKGARYVIDTSRNGAPIQISDWCNPHEAKVGNPPAPNLRDKRWPSAADDLRDADLWIKPPGESDGTCNGGPTAGEFWKQAALQLAG